MDGRADLSLCGVQYKLAEFGIALHNIGRHDIKRGTFGYKIFHLFIEPKIRQLVVWQDFNKGSTGDNTKPLIENLLLGAWLLRHCKICLVCSSFSLEYNRFFVLFSSLGCCQGLQLQWPPFNALPFFSCSLSLRLAAVRVCQAWKNLFPSSFLLFQMDKSNSRHCGILYLIYR